MGHAVKGEGGAPGVGCFHLVPYGVPVMGPCRTEGLCGYGCGPAPVCGPCLADGACACLEGGCEVSQVKCLETYGGVQDPREVVCQALVGWGEGVGGHGRIFGGEGPGVIATFGGGWYRLGLWSASLPGGWWLPRHAWEPLFAPGWGLWQPL